METQPTNKFCNILLIYLYRPLKCVVIPNSLILCHYNPSKLSLNKTK